MSMSATVSETLGAGISFGGLTSRGSNAPTFGEWPISGGSGLETATEEDRPVNAIATKMLVGSFMLAFDSDYCRRD
jgi:hypothetical protein